ncbi:putative nuclease HARBI1 [Lineus longissimus]|uniref:putative nuclease HARBI1 n=1 Tax=Lineus longissimus TaxID=88925 RepID=UPI00315D4BBF
MARRIFELAELVERRRALRRERVFRDRRNPLDIFSDGELLQRYRFSRNGIMFITDLVTPHIEHPTRRSSALLPYQQVLIALQYYGTGTSHKVVGDPLQVSPATANRAIHRVSNALAGRINDFIKFPEGNELGPIKDGFYQMRHFPGVIGCVDGTHVWIISPHQNEVDYVNRKGYHSINVQVMCDHRGKWINLVARWPGSAHDSRILRSSQVWDTMEAGLVQAFILGDSGYPCRNWLMTPLLNPTTASERRYNAAHKSTRVLVEQTIGRWKRRFYLLHLESRLKDPESTCKVIAATAVLHNIAVDRNEPDVEYPGPVREEVRAEDYHGNFDIANGHRARTLLIQNRF